MRLDVPVPSLGKLADICQSSQWPEELLVRFVGLIWEFPATPLRTLAPKSNYQIRRREIVKRNWVIQG